MSTLAMASPASSNPPLPFPSEGMTPEATSLLASLLSGRTPSLLWPASASVELASPAGKALFQQSLAAGELEGYFSLSQNLVTQSDARIAPLTTLSVVLNALNHDPGARWKGPWRWNSEEMMLCGSREASSPACGHDHGLLEKGMTVADFAALARCKGVRAVRHGAGGAGGAEALRARCREVCSDVEAARQMVVCLDREEGARSFCAVGGYNAEQDMVMLLDVARGTHPPAWARLAQVWDAMEAAREGKTGGGYVILSSWTTEKPTSADLCPTAVRSWAEHEGAKQQARAPRRGGRKQPPVGGTCMETMLGPVSVSA